MTKECPTCDGKGEAVFSCCTGELVTDDLMMCPKCYEHLGEDKCDDCNGSGEVPETQNDFTDKAPSLQLQAEQLVDSLKENRNDYS